MAGALRKVLRHTLRNPLSARGTALPPALLVVARGLALVVLLRGEQPFRLFLPYVELMDSLGTPWAVQASLRLASLVGCGLILVTRNVRLGSALVGGAFLLGLLSCRPCLSVAHTYLACVFLVLSMSSRASGAKLLRAQVVVLYLGAALNKVVDVDWWNGRYFDTLMIENHREALYAALASRLPGRWLGSLMGVATIVAQLVIGVCLGRRRWRAAGIFLGLLFHGTMVLWLQNSFGPFYAILVLSYLAFVRWPERIDLGMDAGRPGARALASLDVDDRIRFVDPDPDGAPEVRLDGDRFRGAAGLGLALLFQPVTPLALAVLLAGWPLGVTVQLASVAALALLASVALIHGARLAVLATQNG